MNDDIKQIIQLLESQWSMPDGFLGRVRQGIFDAQEGDKFSTTLESIKIPPGNSIDRRVVSLIWYIPQFLEWQQRRVEENGGDALAFHRLTNKVLAIVEHMLGVP